MRELDEITLTRAIRGDAAAFRELVVTYQRPVHALIERVLARRGSRAQVEELAQETFLRVYRALPGYQRRGSGRPSRWILTIAGRLAIDELRKRRVATTALDDVPEPAGPDSSATLAVRARLSSAIARAAADLSDDHRAVFVLRDYHDFDYGEIARVLDIDIGTVKSRLSRARAALRRSLAEVCHG